jgi:hypothetical protein
MYVILQTWCSGSYSHVECSRSWDQALVRQTKDYEIGICYFSASHAALRNKNKDWLTLNLDYVSEWNDIYTCQLLFQCSTFNTNLSMLAQYIADIIIISSKCNLFLYRCCMNQTALLDLPWGCWWLTPLHYLRNWNKITGIFVKKKKNWVSLSEPLKYSWSILFLNHGSTPEHPIKMFSSWWPMHIAF